MRRLLIFFAVGALLFAVKQALSAHLTRPEPLVLWLPPQSPDERAHSVERALLAEAALEMGAAHRDPVVRERLLTLLASGVHEAPVGDALLAIAHELDLFHRDRLLETRLAGNATLRLKASLDVPAPSDTELTRYLSAHKDRYQRSERFSFVQLFVARGLEEEGRARAHTLRDTLVKKQVGPNQSASYGEPCNLPRRVEQSSTATIARRFGSRIAAALPRLEPDMWSEPLDSTLGLHLIWPLAHQPASPMSLDEARDRVLTDYMAEARQRALADALLALGRERPVQVHELRGALP